MNTFATSSLASSRDEIAAWLRLTLEPDLKPAQVRTLLGVFGLPQHLYAAPMSALLEHVPQALAIQLRQAPDEATEQKIQASLEWLCQPDCHVLTLADADYPPLLLHLPQPPLVLYVHGQLACLQMPALAVVGARNATPAGCENARAFASYLAGRNWCIVSGLAHGIDAAAHEGALAAAGQGGNGATVAVMGTGLDIVYPRANLKLAHCIVENGGALVSEYPLGTRALAHHFPQRNRIVAGLTRGVLVVEAARQSGSLITARLAGELGREVFAIPGSIHSPLSRGCHALIRQGAKLVESGQDIVEEMGAGQGVERTPSRTSGANRVVATAATTASSDEADDAASNGVRSKANGTADDPVLTVMGYDPIDADTLQTRCALSTSELNAVLTQLELEGHIARLADGRWQRM